MSHQPELFIAGSGAYVPSCRNITEAISSGHAPGYAADLEYDSVAISESESAPEMAVKAARAAVARSGIQTSEIALTIHSNVWHQGLEFWQPASYISSEVVGDDAFSVELRQACVGGLTAIQFASSWLRGSQSTAALLTTGDVFAMPAVDRWRIQRGVVFGDAGTAVVISNRAGFARVLSMSYSSHNSYEGWNRGKTPLSISPQSGSPADVMQRQFEYSQVIDHADYVQTFTSKYLACRDEALSRAKKNHDDVNFVVTPFTGRKNLTRLGFSVDQSAWKLGAAVGHLAAGDHFAGLNFLMESGRLRPGDLVLLIGLGSGYSYAAVLLEILDNPY